MTNTEALWLSCLHLTYSTTIQIKKNLVSVAKHLFIKNNELFNTAVMLPGVGVVQPLVRQLYTSL